MGDVGDSVDRARPRAVDGLAAPDWASSNATQWAAVMEQLPDAASIVDTEGRLVWANGAWEHLTGWRVRDALALCPSVFLSGLDTDAGSIEAMRHAERSGERFEGELLLYRRDGSTVWMRIRRVPFLSGDGSVAAILETGRDVTVERERDRRVSQSRAFLASLVRSSVDGFFAVDRDHRIVEWNHALATWTNLPRALVIGDPLDDMLPVDNPATRRLHIDEVLSTGNVDTEERQLYLPCSGQSLQVEIVLSAIHDVDVGETIGVLGQVRDVGAQHAALDAARRERARLEEAIAVIDSGFAMFDQHETLVVCNAQYRDGRARTSAPTAGMSLSEVLALELVERGHGPSLDTRDALSMARKLERHRGAGGAFEERIGQRVRRVEVARTAADERVILETDITALKETQASLELARDAANAASRAKSLFLANMSHELRTPLNSIIGFSRQVLRMARAGTVGERDLVFLDRIYSNGVHLLSLINGILDLSKIESGRVDVSIGTTDIARLATESLAIVDGFPREKGVELRSHIPRGLAPVQTDAALLKQVIVNLVANALKFTREGHVSLIVETDASSVPIAICIEDTGIGIPASRLEAIFEAFEQASVETTRQFGGTGLGLAISRSICLLIGATLSVESVEGKGSIFRIDLATRAA